MDIMPLHWRNSNHCRCFSPDIHSSHECCYRWSRCQPRSFASTKHNKQCQYYCRKSEFYSNELNTTVKLWSESILERDYAKIGCIVSIIALVLALIASYPVLYNFFNPIRAELTISVDSISFSFTDSTTASMSVPVTVINYSPQIAHITDWSLMLNFNGTPFQFPNQNCTHGLTELSPSQQTEFVFSYDISNNASLSHSLTSGVFTITYIDSKGTQQEQFEFSRGHQRRHAFFISFFCSTLLPYLEMRQGSVLGVSVLSCSSGTFE